MKVIYKRFNFASHLCVAMLSIFALISTSQWVYGDTLKKNFQSPPSSAKPRVWWHWMDGNVTEQGISKDLQWMHRVGIGGLHNVDIGLNTPIFVDKRQGFLSAGWKDSIRYSVELAADLGMEFGVFSSPGWSLTGGPWVSPKQAMKKLVWSETRVAGNRLFRGKLPALPNVTGPFQNTPTSLRGALVGWDPNRALPSYSQDTVVIAYREPAAVQTMPAARITSNFESIDFAAIVDGDATTGINVPEVSGAKPPWIQINYESPQEIRSVTVSVSPPGSFINVGFSEDGRKFKHLKTIYMGSASHTTESFEAIRSKHFRFSFNNPPPVTDLFFSTANQNISREGLDEIFGLDKPVPQLVIQDVILRTAARVNSFELKAGFEIAQDYYSIASPDFPKSLSVKRGDVVNLTGLMQPDGTLEWQAPHGNWIVLRMGYSLTGSVNHAASPQGTGLEVDKLNRQYVEEYLNTYLGIWADTLGPSLIGTRGLNALMMDSVEVRPQNWTDDILGEFEKRRGYDPLPWLPTLTGIVVDGSQQSDKFLWDFRKTISDLMLDNHNKVIAEITEKLGLTLYGEALESYRVFLGDDMDLRRYTDIPTAAMWTFSPETGAKPGHIADIRGAASVAHIYGQNLVAAESLTSALSPWAYAPRDLKPIIDLEFALGVNRPIIHSSVHQPLDDMIPGFSLSIFGQYFNRHDTWAEQAKSWIDYLSRSSYLLQQGRYAADIAYFYGEEAPLVSIFGSAASSGLPVGYPFDFINADVILNELSVSNGEFLTRSGMRYRLIYLGGSSANMTLSVLQKLRELVSLGGIVVGDQPIGSPSLADDPEEFLSIAQDIWGLDGLPDGESRNYHKGKVFRKKDVMAALLELDLPEDFAFTSTDQTTELLFLHRIIPSGHIYFVSNRTNRRESLEATFRVSGKAAELWHADTGKVRKSPFRIKSNRTIIPLDLGPFESVFVVFREDTEERSFSIPDSNEELVKKLDGKWKLSVPRQGDMAPITAALELESWSQREEKAIRYFSGTATYVREFTVSKELFKDSARLMLDLGDVRELAEVSVNQQELGVLWKPPYRVDITEAIHSGRNILEVKVTNLWVNRLIGDQQTGVKALTSTSVPTYLAKAPLRPSGLIGPVRITRLTEH